MALTFAAQLAVLSQRDVVILEWRPTDLAAIALNYYRNGFDFLHPQILWGGNGPGYVEMEFPLTPVLASPCCIRVFGVHDWVALAIPMMFGIGLAVVVNRVRAHVLRCSRRVHRRTVRRDVTDLAGDEHGPVAGRATRVLRDARPVSAGALGRRGAAATFYRGRLRDLSRDSAEADVVVSRVARSCSSSG